MTEESNNTWDFIIGLGLLIGIGALILISRQKTVTVQSQPKSILGDWKPLDKIPRIEDLFPSIPVQTVTAPTQHQIVPKDIVPKDIVPMPSQGGKKYKNKEVTEYIRDNEGDIVRKIVIRDAEIDGR